MTITPDMAAKVLDADLRNIVKKVSEGGVLSASERAMLQNCAVPGGEVKVRRAAVLLTKYATGARLTASELVEIHEVHPDFAATECVSELTAPGSIPSFALADGDGPRIVGKRAKYPEPLSVYAARFGSDERTLKRYVARGREVDPPDLPPFHRPADLHAWCERRMPNRCPQWVLDIASKFHEPAEKLQEMEPSAPIIAEKPLVVATSDIPHAGESAGRDFSDVEILDLAANVEELRRSLAVSLRLLNEAQRGNDEALIGTRQRVYNTTFDMLRKAENDLVTWRREMGLLVPREDVRRENNRIASTVVSAVMRLLKTARPQLSGKSEPEQDRIWLHETRNCFSVLKGAKFTIIDVDSAIIPT